LRTKIEKENGTTEDIKILKKNIWELVEEFYQSCILD